MTETNLCKKYIYIKYKYVYKGFKLCIHILKYYIEYIYNRNLYFLRTKVCLYQENYYTFSEHAIVNFRPKK